MSWIWLVAAALNATSPAGSVTFDATASQEPVSPSSELSIRLVQAIRLERGVRMTLALDHPLNSGRLEVRLDTGVDRLAGRDPWSFVLPASVSNHLEATLFFPGAPREGRGSLIVSELSEPFREARCPIDLSSDPLPPRIPGLIATFTPPLEILGPSIQLLEGSPGPRGQGWTRIYTDQPDVTLSQIRSAIELPTQVWAGSGGLLFIHPISAREAWAFEVQQNRIIRGIRIDIADFRSLVGARTRFTNRVWPTR